MEKKKKYVALTFDDGPNTTTTCDVLDKLEKLGVKASFFLVGNNITPETEEVIRREDAMGCEIHNHSRTHSAMCEMSDEEISAEIKFTSDKIEAITGKRPAFFRPPYIAVSDNMFGPVGLPFIAGFGAEDWIDEISAEKRAQRIIAQAKDGAIILLHDMEGNFRTVDALDEIVTALRSQGYEFVTMTELFAKGGLPLNEVPHIVYSCTSQTI
ncbi:MAG: polysaccharide deacetylase family protein [Huintestinicola sp.]